MENRKTKEQQKGNCEFKNRPSNRSTSTVPRRNLRESVSSAKNKQHQGSFQGQKSFKENQNQRNNIRRDKNMFPTDINMRNSDTQAGELQERKRHNKRSEELEERGQNMQIGGKALTAAGKIYSGIGGAAIKALAANHPEWYLKDALLADQNTQISTQIPVGYNQKVFSLQTRKLSDKTACFTTYYYSPLMCAYYGTYTDDPNEAASYVRSAPMNYVNKALYA